MLLPRERLINMPVMSLQTGTQVGLVVGHIIDPRRLNIVALYCEGPLIDYKPAILHVSDIREFSSIGLIVDSADNIMPPDDLVRLKEVLDFHFELDGKPVIEQGGRKMGRVDGYTVDSESFYIVKLQVRPGFLQSFMQAEVLVDRTQIAEINEKHIVVRRATVRDEAREPLAMPVVDNPFRKTARTMPEAHSNRAHHHKKKESAEEAHPTQG